MERIHNIFLVEDDDGIRESVAECLEAEGYAVESAENGAQALERLHGRAPPDLVFVDLVMPVMNGAELIERMRADPALRSVPVVVMTAATPVAGVPLPQVDAVLAKPFELEQLLEVVARHCRPAA